MVLEGDLWAFWCVYTMVYITTPMSVTGGGGVTLLYPDNASDSDLPSNHLFMHSFKIG